MGAKIEDDTQAKKGNIEAEPPEKKVKVSNSQGESGDAKDLKQKRLSYKRLGISEDEAEKLLKSEDGNEGRRTRSRSRGSVESPRAVKKSTPAKETTPSKRGRKAKKAAPAPAATSAEEEEDAAAEESAGKADDAAKDEAKEDGEDAAAEKGEEEEEETPAAEDGEEDATAEPAKEGSEKSDEDEAKTE